MAATPAHLLPFSDISSNVLNGTLLYDMVHRKTGIRVCYVPRKYGVETTTSISFRNRSSRDGVGHVLEHCVLNGSKKYPVENAFFSTASRVLTTHCSAITMPTFSAFTVTTPQPGRWLPVLVDLLFNPLLSSGGVIREKIIAANEVSSSMKSPDYHLINILQNRLQPRFPHPAGGIPHHIVGVTPDEVRLHHKKNYHPRHCIFSVLSHSPSVLLDVDRALRVVDVGMTDPLPTTVKSYSRSKNQYINESHPAVVSPAVTSAWKIQNPTVTDSDVETSANLLSPKVDKKLFTCCSPDTDLPIPMFRSTCTATDADASQLEVQKQAKIQLVKREEIKSAIKSNSDMWDRVLAVAPYHYATALNKSWANGKFSIPGSGSYKGVSECLKQISEEQPDCVVRLVEGPTDIPKLTIPRGGAVSLSSKNYLLPSTTESEVREYYKHIAEHAPVFKEIPTWVVPEAAQTILEICRTVSDPSSLHRIEVSDDGNVIFETPDTNVQEALQKVFQTILNIPKRDLQTIIESLHSRLSSINLHGEALLNAATAASSLSIIQKQLYSVVGPPHIHFIKELKRVFDTQGVSAVRRILLKSLCGVRNCDKSQDGGVKNDNSVGVSIRNTGSRNDPNIILGCRILAGELHTLLRERRGCYSTVASVVGDAIWCGTAADPTPQVSANIILSAVRSIPKLLSSGVSHSSLRMIKIAALQELAHENRLTPSLITGLCSATPQSISAAWNAFVSLNVKDASSTV